MFPTSIPALRERPEDIPLLVRHFAQQFGQRMNKKVDAISFETMEALTRDSGPGNIRELQNVMERAVVVYEKGNLSVKKVDSLANTSTANSQNNRSSGGLRGRIEN